jgi:PAS domain-containing protein
MKGDLLERCWAWLTSGSRDETEQELIENMESLIQSKVNDNNRSEVCGNIQILNSPRSAPQRGGILQASVPTGELSFDENVHTMSFLLFSVDLTAYRKRTSYLALGAVIAFTVMILILASSWWWASRDTLKYQQDFELLRSILSKLPDLPWARLDLQHKICDFNEPFCKKLEYPFDDDTREKIIGVKFWRLCVRRDDAEHYKKAQEDRKKTGKFALGILNMRKFGGGSIKVKIISMEVPSVKNNNSSEIFCILMPFDFSTRSLRKSQA